ncbi:hypothetical protein F5878DRAFT_628453 [Lentinula raphanica]|uniref:Uncharacterized protein n=1 Tax=Lentinula raphanica TaxID=153919 RepID=A0AA38U9Z8_9AGAR|nr:hypothetical protein F5878DRAFT_628453 [Lentinula raphanica]
MSLALGIPCNCTARKQRFAQPPKPCLLFSVNACHSQARTLNFLPSLSRIMQSCSPFPNEILHHIIEYVAYTPEMSGAIDLGSRSIGKSLFKHASPALLALSVAKWRLRRVCLPFLLANIEIGHDKDAQKLEKDLPLCAKFTKTLVIGRFAALTEDGENITSRILPQLKQLVEVKLPDCWDRSDMLRIILAHPTVTSVLVDEVPNVSMRTQNLSKMILNYSSSSSAFSPQFATYFAQGMRLMCLGLENDSVGSRLECMNFPGLEEIELHIRDRPIPFSWLSPFSSTHPTLNKLWLLNIKQDAPPFLSSLVEESQRQGLQHVFRISGVGLRRAKPIDRSSQDWRVMELSLSITAGSKRLIEILALNLQCHKGMYDIDDVASVFARFSSLRVIHLQYVYERLNFGPSNENFVRSVQEDGSIDSLNEPRARAESRLSLFTSCLAKQVRTLDSVYIDDENYTSDGCDWCLRGWLHVLDSSRDVGGTLGDYY